MAERDISAAVLRAAVRITLVASILGFIPGLLDPFTAAKSLVLRAAGLPMLAYVLAEALLARRAPRHPLDVVPLAWLGAAALSTFLGISPRLSISGEIEQREGLLTVAALTGLYFGARRSHRDDRDTRVTLLTVIAAASMAAAYAMLQRAGLDPLGWVNAPSYPVEGAAVPRPFATLGNPILLGMLLAPAFAAGLGLATAPAPRPAWLVPALVLVGAAAVATLSRGTLLAAAVGAAIAAAGTLRGAEPRERRRGIVALVWILVPAVLWSGFALGAPIAARLAESLSTSAESGPARLEIARSALALWGSRPLLGVGPDAFGLAFPAVQTPDYWRNGWIGNPVHAHSVPLQVLATGGALAAIAGSAWLATLGSTLLRARRRSADRAVRAALLGGLAALIAGGSFNVVGLAAAAVFVVGSAVAVTGQDPARAAPAASAAAGPHRARGRDKTRLGRRRRHPLRQGRTVRVDCDGSWSRAAPVR